MGMHDAESTAGGRKAADLTEDELGVAAWFEHLARVDAPEGLKARILGGRAVERATPAKAGRVLAFPLGRWGVASAALLLLALGAAVAVELIDPVDPAQPAVDAHAAAQARADEALKQTIHEDENLALYHGVETFDEVGLAPGELIADWGR